MVEAAIITPFAFFLMFGMIEFGLLLRTEHAVGDASSNGVRVAAAHPREPESTGPDAGFAPRIKKEVEDSLTSLGAGDVDFIAIYLAEDNGLPAGADSDDEIDENCGAGTSCPLYGVANGPDGWKFADTASFGGDWDPSTVDACPVLNGVDTRDRVGVYVQANYDFLTPWIADIFSENPRPVTDRTVTKFEPVQRPTLANPCSG